MTTATTDIWIRRGSWGASENVLLFGRCRSNLSCAETKEKNYGVDQLRNSSSVKSGPELLAKAWLAFAGLHTPKPCESQRSSRGVLQLTVPAPEAAKYVRAPFSSQPLKKMKVTQTNSGSRIAAAQAM